MENHLIHYDLIVDVALMPMQNATAKVLLIALSNYSNAEGECFPSQQKLSEDTLIPIRTIARTLHWLEANEFLRVLRRPNKPNFYVITSMEEDMSNKNGYAKMADEVVSNITKLELARVVSNTSSPAKMAHPNDNPMFQAFWQAYPRRIGKGAARTAFKRAIKFSSGDEIVQGAIAYATHCEEMGTEKQYIPHPSTWLNAERWEDDLESEKVETKKTIGWLNEL